jgi:hypothetical protein
VRLDDGRVRQIGSAVSISPYWVHAWIFFALEFAREWLGFRLLHVCAAAELCCRAEARPSNKSFSLICRVVLHRAPWRASL